MSKKNVPFERRTFREAVQEPTEGIDAYVTRLRGLAKTCEFDKVDEMIRDQGQMCFEQSSPSTLALDRPQTGRTSTNCSIA